MSQTASQHLNRIVQLVADASRDPDAADRGIPIGELAARLGTTPAQVQQDIRTLTAISDEASAEWLQSLSVWQEGDRVAAVSRGPYRRPLRFTPEELLAIRVGLALEAEAGARLARRLDDALALHESPEELGAHKGRPYSPLPAVAIGGAPDGEAAVIAMAREAIDESRTLDILYAGEREPAGSVRSVEPHQVVSSEGHYFVSAWCRRTAGWRLFRADRVLDAALGEATFTPRADYRPVTGPADLFRTEADGEDVTVRYSATVARWLAERFPDARSAQNGGVEVTYRVVEPSWLVRMVLQYGDEAEVVAPPGYRELMRRSVVNR